MIELPSFIVGSLRLALSLCLVICAALFFIRVRVINIAIDGQIAFAAVVYVWAASSLNLGLALLLPFIVSLGTGLAISGITWLRQSDTILVSFGVLSGCMGMASIASSAASGKAGNAPLARDIGIGEGPAGALALAAVTICILALYLWRELRVSKVIGEAKGAGGTTLADLSGIDVRKWTIVNIILGSALIAVASVYLVEQGGGYTKFISGERGFLALAVVVVARRSPAFCIVFSLLFGMGQRLAMTPSEFNELLEAGPFLLALVLLAFIGIRRRFTERPARILRRRIPV